jgi:choline kinase
VHGLILAAGSGSRLGTRLPKCLAEVGGRTLLRIQLDALRQAGVRDITVVVGYRHEEVRAAASGEVAFVHNDRFAETNSMYSFLLARPAVDSDVVVLNSDVVFPVELLERVLEVGGSAFAFDSGSGADEEHMKVRLDGGRLVAMSKDLPAAVTDGENVGLVHLSAPAARASFAAAAALVGAGHLLGWLAQAVTAVAGAHQISGVDIAGLPWVEIDFPEDLVVARDKIWPSIESLGQFTQRSRSPGAFWSANDADAAVAG